ncbi:hypothetical protein OF83DRAFT_1174969 [Amylostereum chailletii]|nr:hypothetical protein OF83DRAFT_1174969 [Amylostereum chailletii]
MSPATPPPLITTLSDVPTVNDPPPPYPAPRDRRRRVRRVFPSSGGHSQLPSAGTESENETGTRVPPRTSYLYPDSGGEENGGRAVAGETTPLLLSVDTARTTSPRLPHPPPPPRVSPVGLRSPGGVRPRRVSQSSTVHSGVSRTPSLAQAFRMELDSDGEDGGEVVEDDEGYGEEDQEGYEGEAEEADVGRGRRRGRGDAVVDRLGDAQGMGRRRVKRSWAARTKNYFKPLFRRAYWSPLLHLLVFNFPYALLAAVYLFVFTLVGTTLLVALPLGAVLCFFDLLGARTLARGEVRLQSTFHGPLAYELEEPLPPIFTRVRARSAGEVEAGSAPQTERSFYRNTYAMFTDPLSYQALFYFLVIKPSITLLLSLLLLVMVPVALVLVVPAPGMLRFVRRVGIWQANVALEGLYMGGS